MTDNRLILATTEQFGNISTNIYKDKNNDMFMTSRQIGECLGFSDPKKAISTLVNRNDYLKDNTFSTVLNLRTLDGKQRNTRVFNEDGIYEVTFLANTEKAKEFRCWVRKILKSLRKGDIQLSQNNLSLTPQMIEQIIDNKLGLYYSKTEEKITNLIKAINTAMDNPQKEISQYEAQFDNKEWKDNVYSIVKQICDADPYTYPITNSDFINSKVCLRRIYAQMRDIYGFVEQQERKEYMKRHNSSTSNISTIELVADNSQWKDIFNNLLQEKLESITDVQAEQPCLSYSVQRYAYLTDIIKPLAEKYHDDSKGYSATYRRVYKQMGCDFKRLLSRYRNVHNLKNKPSKRKLISERPDLERRFKKAVDFLLNT